MLKAVNRVAFASVALALTATNCGSGAEPPAASAGSVSDISADVVVSPSATVAGPGLQFDDLPPIDREVIARAGVSHPEDLIDLEYQIFSSMLTDCMAERGFEFDRGPRPGLIDPLGHRPRHPLDVEYALKYGYRAAPRPPSPMNDLANSDTDFFDALFDLFDKDQSSGCFEQVARFVNDETGSLQLADDITALRQSPLEDMAGWQTTAEYQQLIAEWSGCMKGQGYEFNTPSDALGSAGDEGPAPQEEIALRLADIECDRSAGLTAGRSQYESGVVGIWADESADAIKAMAERVDEVSRQLIDLQGVDHQWS